MTKKGPLGKAEEFYVENHFTSKSVDEIAKELDRSKTSINKFVEKCKKNAPAVEFNAGTQMAKQEGVTVMTQNASMFADEAKKKTKSKVRSCITTIKGD